MKEKKGISGWIFVLVIISFFVIVDQISIGNSKSINSVEQITTTTEYVIIGNKNTNKYHAADCSYLPYKENRIYFSSEEEAIEAGMHPCQHCKWNNLYPD